MMEIETDVGGLVVRMAGNPAEAAAYVAALAMMNGHSAETVAPSKVITPELFPMEPTPDRSPDRSPRALAAVPTPPEPDPGPDREPDSDSREVFIFHVSKAVYEAIKATGVDVRIFNKGTLEPNGPGYSWIMRLNADDAVNLYKCINAGVEKGAGRKVPSVYTTRRKLEATLDEHFGIHEGTKGDGHS